MSEETPDTETPATDHQDPKELMREALERKQAHQHRTADAANTGKRATGGPHGPLGGKRTFRRKAGG